MGDDDINCTGAASEASDPALDEALDWFTRLRSGAVTEEDQRAFDSWRNADPAHGTAFTRIADLWGSTEFARAVTDHTDLPVAGPERRPTPSSWRHRASAHTVLALAAMLVLAVGLTALSGGFFLNHPDYATEQGHRNRITLPDGSVMVLNSDSAVVLDFTDQRRRVALLRGEVYFDVRRNPDRPFEVTAGRSLTRVIGTAFSVTLDGDSASVAVNRGEVEVTGDTDKVGVHLTPGQGLLVLDGRSEEPAAIARDEIFAWLNGRIIFHDRPLAEVVALLARHHHGMVVLASDRLRQFRVSGNYRLDDPVAVIKALASTVGADVTGIPEIIQIVH